MQAEKRESNEIILGEREECAQEACGMEGILLMKQSKNSGIFLITSF